ncbi:MAG: hypothetical protein KF752_09230 [Pirellulaceae bacterium]|nr:hypothetical protein [Pirellulaceae bacterium]
MKSATHSGVFATDPRQSWRTPARAAAALLVLRDDSGQIAKQWPIAQAKATLGSAENCTFRCQLPGIAPFHALIVNGSRQTFIRALAPQLSQDGRQANELLLAAPSSHFEIAGHRFEILRSPLPSATEVQQQQRLRFAVSRPLSLSAEQAIAASTTSPLNPSAAGLPREVDIPWVSDLIRKTIEPLEAQIESLLLPIAEFRAQSVHDRRQSDFLVETELEKHSPQSAVATTENADSALSAMPGQVDRRRHHSRRSTDAQRAHYEKASAEISEEITTIIARQSATLEALSERLQDVNHQLSTIEGIIAEETSPESSAQSQVTQELTAQRTAIEQLQTGMVAVTESLNQLHDKQQSAQSEGLYWKSEVQLQLEQLSGAVAQLTQHVANHPDTSVLEAIQSLQTSQQQAQEEIQKWQYCVQEQLEKLDKQLHLSTTRPLLEAAAQSSAPQSDHESGLPTRTNSEASTPTLSPQLGPRSEAGDSALESPASGQLSIGAAEQFWDSEASSSSPDNGWLDQWSANHSEATSSGPVPSTGNAGSIANASVSDGTNPNIPAWFIADEHATPAPIGGPAALTMPQPAHDTLSDWGMQSSQMEPTSADDIASNQPEIKPTQHEQWQRSQSLIQDDTWDSSMPGATSEQAFERLSAERLVEETFRPQNQLPASQASELSLWETESIALDTPEAQPPVDVASSTNWEEPELFMDGQSVDLPAEMATSQQGRLWPSLAQGRPTSNLSALSAVDEQVVPLAAAELTREPQASAQPDWWTAEESLSIGGLQPLPAREQQATSRNDNRERAILDLRRALLEDVEEFEQPTETACLEADALDADACSMWENARLADSGDDAKATSHCYHDSSSSTAGQSLADEMPVGMVKGDEPSRYESAILNEPDDPAFEVQDDMAVLPEHNFHAPVSGELFGLGSSPSRNPATASDSVGDGAEEESVEEYMQRLLARMRGDSGPVATAAVEARPKAVAAPIQTARSAFQPTPPELTPEARGSFDFDSYKSRTNAPEKPKNITALRDLANSSARTAIHKSTRQRYLSTSLLKLSISMVGFTVAAVLVAINGVAMNIGLVATVASLFVAIIWGYDGAKGLKPLLNNGLVLSPPVTDEFEKQVVDQE